MVERKFDSRVEVLDVQVSIEYERRVVSLREEGNS
jgi:hypothetical protein